VHQIVSSNKAVIYGLHKLLFSTQQLN